MKCDMSLCRYFSAFDAELMLTFARISIADRRKRENPVQFSDLIRLQRVRIDFKYCAPRITMNSRVFNVTAYFIVNSPDGAAWLAHDCDMCSAIALGAISCDDDWSIGHLSSICGKWLVVKVQFKRIAQLMKTPVAFATIWLEYVDQVMATTNFRIVQNSNTSSHEPWMRLSEEKPKKKLCEALCQCTRCMWESISSETIIFSFDIIWRLIDSIRRTKFMMDNELCST